MIDIPEKIKVGGQNIDIEFYDVLPDNMLGDCTLAEGKIRIAHSFNGGTKQSLDSQINTFYHEMIHAILDTMGERNLSANEKFVSVFAGFLTEALKSGGVCYEQK